MGMSKLRLVWIYPDLLSTYGDQGNVLIVERRALMRGIEVERVDVRSDQPVPTSGDIYLIGGGEDRPQRLAAERLRKDPGLGQAVARGATLLAVCAGYQIIGHEFVDDLDRVEPGLGLLDVKSGRGPAGRRCVGEVLADVDPELALPPLSGFENHQGVTHIGPGAKALGRVTAGFGNGTDDGTEGAYAGRVLGTYLHGPVMSRNPALADLLLTWATGVPLTPLEDRWHEQLRAERLRAARSAAS
ncbi:type 1 glutamine amidotransferase [Yinghuangia sp. YIM S10712]|uniref:type 1 glutamine amidotransferase n=1 Tax=Yinghuangia sp. YIM S10712 TaxID=3436930 RepID=UPI003F535D04